MIIANVLVFIVTDVFGGLRGSLAGYHLKERFMLSLALPEILDFFTYQFLHGDIWHLAGNMVFLWVFGNAVNSKMGHLPYLFFYLACGVFAAVGFAVASALPSNLIGASGAIAGVTMAYLVLFPRSEVSVFYWLFIIIGVWRIRAMLLILLKVVLWDNILAPSLGGGTIDSVAYSAHIAGYLFGFIVCIVLLLVRALPRDQYDILALIKRHHQRQQFRAAMADPTARAQATYGRVARPISAVTARPVEPWPNEAPDAVSRLRAEIADLVADHAYSEAAERYEALVVEDPNQCLPRKQMLMVSNQLMTLQRYPQAAAAYEKYLKAYPTDGDVVQVRLVLGILYARYLQQTEQARTHLLACLPRLTDPEQIRQARHYLGDDEGEPGSTAWTVPE
ncbi:MAG: rhomboid family intramembrane serine protease [Planctomycetota bacterium]